MILTPPQLDLLRSAVPHGVSPSDEPTTADLRILAGAGLLLEDAGGRFHPTDAGSRYLAVETAGSRSA